MPDTSHETIPLMYVSGMSSTTDFAGVADASMPVGVQAQHVSSAVVKQIADYTSRGGKVFVDSGAFPAFTKGETVDFDKVLEFYGFLADTTSYPENLAIVAPDVIGNMDETAHLQQKYINMLKVLVAKGAELLVPFQCGWEKTAYCKHYNAMTETLGLFTLAFACNKAAWSPMDVGRLVEIIKPKRVHLLGVGTRYLDKYLRAIRWTSPETIVSCDANRTRAMIGENRPITNMVQRAERRNYVSYARNFNQCYDDTELLFDLYNTAGYLTGDEAKEIGRLLGVTNPHKLNQWAKASQKDSDGEYGCLLGEMLGRHDPTGWLTYILVGKSNGKGLRRAFGILNMKQKRPQERRMAIKTATIEDHTRRVNQQLSKCQLSLQYA